MARYKILLITNFSKPWHNGWYYKKGFESNQHEVITFDPATEPDPEENIFKIVKEANIDFILHTKDEMPVEIFQRLREHSRVIQWYPDPVIPEWLPPYVKASDIFFTMSDGLVGEFRKLNPHVYWMTQGFEPSFFEVHGITDGDRKRYSSDITFVGNLGSKLQYLPRRKYLQRILDEGIDVRWWGPRLPRKLSTIPLIFGRLGRAFGGRGIWGEDYAKAATLSKIFLAFDSMPHIRKSMSARMYTAVGCGAFYLCRYVEGIEEILEPGKEIVTFQSEDEMIDMIRYFLRNEDERMKIAQAGRNRVLKDHTYAVRTEQMIDIIKNVI